VFLSVLAGRADLAVQLLAKGAQHNPEIWQLHFYLGFDHFYFLGNYKAAADAMARAAELPGRPAYVPLLAARLYAHAEEPGFALEFMNRMYELNKDEQIRGQLLMRIKDITVERDLQALNQAAAEFQRRHQRPPSDLSELVRAGLIPRVPDEPLGGRYYLDPNDRQVKSSMQKERLRVELPQQRLGAPTNIR
jgi:hypothetical protein